MILSQHPQGTQPLNPDQGHFPLSFKVKKRVLEQDAIWWRRSSRTLCNMKDRHLFRLWAMNSSCAGAEPDGCNNTVLE